MEDTVVDLQGLGGLQRNFLLLRHITVAQGATQVAGVEGGFVRIGIQYASWRLYREKISCNYCGDYLH